ncbi:POZ/BTB containin G-protein 1 [Actinidia rufa]|uniref:POZ/BTB containin G-protein 1 n=1 Tax=Actinidia rufa TaxID=165716 RepID=A0A7J0FRF9_9ERIC|nr:POZ/BTB containin G-protein 1 [Actinidia rufa]
MDSALWPVGARARSGSDSDFAFAFNDRNFSDRVLRIEIIPVSAQESKSDPEGCSSIADWVSNRKRRRREENKKDDDVLMHHGEQILNGSMLNIEDGVTYKNEDEEAVLMVKESPSGGGVHTNPLGDEAAHMDDSSWIMGCKMGLEVKTIHISSPILAAKSRFFYKLFSNETRESKQRHVTLRIPASEEAAFMNLLNFMYGNSLSTTTPSAWLDMLMAADKYEVASCMRFCSRLLQISPMTCESALLYLDLPSMLLMPEAVQPLTNVAKQFLAAHYRDMTKFEEELLNLPLAGIEVILSSDDLQVASEDCVYDFVLKWARTHYPNLEERRGMLGTRLGCLIRFPHMSYQKLMKVIACNDFHPELASNVVLEALFFKKGSPRQLSRAVEELNFSLRRFIERPYKHRPIKVMQFELPRRQCVVYLDLKREECARLFPSGRLYSQAFYLGGQWFFLSAHCNIDQQTNLNCFGLFLSMQEKGSVSFAVDYEFAARSKPTEEYMSKYKGTYTFTGGNAVGYRNLFSLPWPAFMANDSLYFIKGILHLRAELTIRTVTLS